MNRLTGCSSLIAGLALGLTVIACGGDDGPADAAIVPDAEPQVGSLSLAWEITDGTALQSCAAVAALSVRISVTPAAGGFGQNDIFGCEAGTVLSRDFDAGEYNIEVTLVAAAGDLAPPFRMNRVEIKTGEETALGTLTFEVAPRGSFDFEVGTMEIGPNCDPVADGGAGLGNLLIELVDTSGECIPATMEIGAGASRPADTYNSDCTGLIYGCIEKDQTVTLTGVRSGELGLRMSGTRDNGGCYERTSQFTVPGNDLQVSLPTQTLRTLVDCP